jgi:predicted alpha/beta-hydrolase family hydrolase
MAAQGLAERGYAVVRCTLVTTAINVRIDAMKAVLSYLFNNQEEKTVKPAVAMLRSYTSRVYIGGHSMGARVVVSIGDELKDNTESSKAKKSSGSKAKSDNSSSVDEAFKNKLHGIITFSYPLHPPGKQLQLRDQILYDLPEATKLLMISGTKDPFGELALMTKIQNKIKCSLTAVRIDKAGHSLSTGKSKKTAKDTGRTQEETVYYWMAQRIEEWIKRTEDGVTGEKRKRDSQKIYELIEVAVANDNFKISRA